MCREHENKLSIKARGRHEEENAVSRGKVWLSRFFQELLHNVSQNGRGRCFDCTTFFELNVLIYGCNQYAHTHILITHINLYSVQVQLDLELFT